ncbi:MAG: LPS-assembly protein [Flavobacteriales bacterium]|jgi:LPS-assembly protein
MPKRHSQFPPTFVAVLTGILYSSLSLASSAQISANCRFDRLENQWYCLDANEQEVKIDNTSDWIPKEYLDASERSLLGAGCEGLYIDPVQKDTSLSGEMGTLPLTIEADHSTLEGGSKALLEGTVRVEQGLRSIGAELMSYDRALDEAELQGDVSIRQPGISIRGDAAEVSTIQQRGSFDKASFVLHDLHMRGEARTISQEGRDRIVLKDGMITSCEPGAKSWSLEGKELSVNHATGQGYGKNVRLKIGSVPIFYLPYITFPVGEARRSGFLFPSISSSDGGGLDIALPYYLNLAPNYDATLTPRYISGRGSMFEGELRHMNHSFINELSVSYLPNDSGGSHPDVEKLIDSNELSEAVAKPHKGDNRWLFHFEQLGGKREGWYSKIDYSKVSDNDYFRDLGTSSFTQNTASYLNQGAQVGFLGDSWNVSAEVHDHQLLLKDLESPYRKLPQLTAEAYYPTQLGQFSLKTQFTNFDLKSSNATDNRLIGRRLFGDYRLRSGAERSWGYVRPEVGYKTLFYQLEQSNGANAQEASPRVGAAQASLDLGLIFERTGERFLQTFEPRVFYLFREYEDQNELYNALSDGQSVNFDSSVRTFSYNQLYRDSRFSGSDRLDDANQVTIGATSRWYSADTGRQLMHLSIGQINHFRDRRISLEREILASENSSEFAAEFGLNIGLNSDVYAGSIYDDGIKKVTRLSAGYNFTSNDDLTLFNISYSYLRRNPKVDESEYINQLDTAFIGPISRQWSIMGRSNYDFENTQELETFLGFEYNDCCYRFRILARRWLDSNIAKLTPNDDAIFDQGIFFEVQLKGLGGSGAKVNSILEDAITGYRAREDRLNSRKK